MYSVEFDLLLKGGRSFLAPVCEMPLRGEGGSVGGQELGGPGAKKGVERKERCRLN